jgi:hypothetical protein
MENGIKFKWYSQKDTSGSEEHKDPSLGTVAANKNLSQLDILVRESIQNSLDAASKPGETVTVRFELKIYKGAEKTEFLNALNWPELCKDVDAHRNFLTEQKRSSWLVPPSDFESADVLPVLFISDHGTRGMIGPEFPPMPHEPKPVRPYSFVALCRNVGANEKSGGNNGGTHGFGKTVLWKCSGIHTVVFDSVLENPAKRPDVENIERRFYGAARLKVRYVDQELRNGTAFLRFGVDGLGRPLSATNSLAQDCAKTLGFPNRDASDPGTTIGIVGLSDFESVPVRLIEEDTAKELVEQLARSAELWFWPAILEKTLVVETVLNGDLIQRVESVTLSDLAPFVTAYRKARKAEVPLIVKVPKLEDEGIAETNAIINLGFDQTDQVKALPEKLRNRVALVRGPGMIIGYQRFLRKGLNASDYIGVALAGAAVDATKEPQKSLDLLLARSEPITHDEWSSHGEQLKNWYGAAAAVDRIIGNIKDEVQSQTGGYVPEGDAAAPELARLLGFGIAGDKRQGGKIVTVEPDDKLKRTQENCDPSSARWTTTYRVIVPKATSKEFEPARKNGLTPERVKVNVSIGYAIVSANAETQEKIPLDPQYCKQGRLSDDNKNLDVELPITNLKQEVLLTVITEQIPSDLANRLKFRDRATVSIGYRREGEVITNAN